MQRWVAYMRAFWDSRIEEMSNTPIVIRPPVEVADALVREYSELTQADLLTAWQTTATLDRRDAILEAMHRRALAPHTWSAARESAAGLYPDSTDPDFALRLWRKTEFADLQTQSVPDDICSPAAAATAASFSTTPVQRLVARFLHPVTPYRSLLVDHGVGVGKTCSAITVAETFLEVIPHNKVLILCPQAIASGFRRTIFDAEKLRALKARDAQLRGEAWDSQQCTGMTYLRLAGVENEPDRVVVEKAVEAVVRRRYQIMGYRQFANWVLKKLSAEIPKTLEGEARTEAENRLLYDLFSDRLLIVDEAHNLRDIGAGVAKEPTTVVAPPDAETMSDESPVVGAATDAAEGKILTPVLRRILRVSEGLRLLLMTATPMYNTAPEIIFLLNLMILNDLKDETQLLKPRDFFTADGALVANKQDVLRRMFGRYVSYMRGENPASFPLRLTPPQAAGAGLFEGYPTHSISRSEGDVTWTDDVKKILAMLPLCVSKPDIRRTAVGRVLYKLLGKARGELGDDNNDDEGSEVSDFILDQATQIGNITYPNGAFGSKGFQTYFKPVAGAGRQQQFVWDAPPDEDDENYTPTVDDVFGAATFAQHCPKGAAIVESVTKARGMCFVFSRYTKAGALPIAIALERAGWTRVLGDGTPAPLLRLPTGQAAPRRACAFCTHKEGQGDHSGHTFSPANFVLLTGDDTLTPDFRGTLRYANTLNGEWEVRGGKVKAILGSQITSEGLDLKAIRENHLMEAWYHLNRTEQVIGRAVRYCSHAALPKAERNCLIYLHAVMIPEYETADLYAYRLAARKAIPIGHVQRLIKTGAWDCLMNRAAVVLRGLPRQRIVDAQGRVVASYNPQDRPYTSICDFQEACEFTCAAATKDTAAAAGTDVSTFEVMDARTRFAEKEKVLRRRFAEEPALSLHDIRAIYSDMPWDIGAQGFRALLDSPRFIVERADGIRGTLHLQNGYVMFQPLGVTDMDIPMALRFGRAYGRLPRYMELSRGKVFETERLMKPLTPAVAAPVTKQASAHTPPPTATSDVGDALQMAGEWKKYVDSKLLTTPLLQTLVPPAGLPAGVFFEGWRWVFHYFRELPDVRRIAYQWYMDNEWTLDQRAAVLRNWTVTPSTADDLVAGFKPVELFTGALSGYHTVDVAKSRVVAHCMFEGDAEPTLCPSNMAKDIEGVIGPAVDKKAGTGPLFGFLVFSSKEGRVVFKTVNKADNSYRGAQCSNTSNLVNHVTRIRIIHEELRAAGREDILALLLDDDPANEVDKKTRQGRQDAKNFKHIGDLTLKQTCPYMEFLLRWMDLHRVGGKRWFLSVVDSVRAGFPMA